MYSTCVNGLHLLLVPLVNLYSARPKKRRKEGGEKVEAAVISLDTTPIGYINHFDSLPDLITAVNIIS